MGMGMELKLHINKQQKNQLNIQIKAGTGGN